MCVVDAVWSFFFFKQRAAYEMARSEWSADVCSSDLREDRNRGMEPGREREGWRQGGKGRDGAREGGRE